MKKILFILLAIASLFVEPAIALFAGIAFAILFHSQFEQQTGLAAKYLLQISIVGLGFGMNLTESLKSSSDGMIFTICSVVIVIGVGVLLGHCMKIDRKLAYLISSGTAICGGSAIAAVAPVIKSNANQISISLAVIFTLNAIAMFIFPVIGHLLDLTQQQFGVWAAIAIHDTSSVIGAGKAYGEEALQIATSVKLTRALWIIPLSIFSAFVFKANGGGISKISIPWFIFLFVLAMVTNTYLPINNTVLDVIKNLSHKSLSLTLFLIGSTLSVVAIRKAGVRPIALGVSLWVLISVLALFVIITFE